MCSCMPKLKIQPKINSTNSTVTGACHGRERAADTDIMYQKPIPSVRSKFRPPAPSTNATSRGTEFPKTDTPKTHMPSKSSSFLSDSNHITCFLAFPVGQRIFYAKATYPVWGGVCYEIFLSRCADGSPALPPAASQRRLQKPPRFSQ